MQAILQERDQQAGLLERQPPGELQARPAADFAFRSITEQGRQQEAASFMTRILQRGIDPVTGQALPPQAMQTFQSINTGIWEIRNAMGGAPAGAMPQAVPPPIRAPLPPAAGMPAAP